MVPPTLSNRLACLQQPTFLFPPSIRPTRRPNAPARVASPKTQPTTPRTDAPFVWDQYWWPVQLESNLKTDRPNRVQLLGEWFVLWRVGQGEWQASADRCPHRLAPLSEGRIESDGTLACAYHGWRFDQDGACVRIPQADGSEAERNACKTNKSRLKKFPCKAYGNILWLWPNASETAFIDAHAEPIPMIPDLAAAMEERAKYGLPAGFTRVLPYSYDVLVENVSDPAHLPVAHHGIPGLDRDNAAALGMKVDDLMDTPQKERVFGSFSYDAIGTPGTWAHVEVSPASTVYRSGKTRDAEEWLGQVLFHTPLAPGKSRAFVFFSTHKVVAGSAKSQPFLLKLMPWFVGNLTNKIFDMDMVFLREQDQYLHAQRIASANGSEDSIRMRTGLQQYFLPSTADLTAATFRKWYDGIGGGGPVYAERGGTFDFSDVPRSVLLDRYHTHTVDCPLSQKGFMVMTRISLGAQILGAGCFLGLSAAVGSHAGWKSVLPWLTGIAACLLAKNCADDQKKNFTYRDFRHADN